MPQRHVARSGAPARSASAARAHSDRAVTWTIDLGQPATVGVQRSVDSSRAYALAGLSLLMAAVWLYDIATLLTHAG